MPGAYFAAAAGVLLLPLEWMVAGIVSAAFHECCHLAALNCFQIPVRQIRIRFGGARITTGLMTPVQELLCAAAGPLGSFCMLLFVRCFPVLGLLGLIQGLFNLLPFYPFDGGRILRSIFLLAKNRH